MNVKALAAEFIGTFTLIFVGVGAIAANQMNDGGSGLVGIALAHGLAIAVMVSATAAVSGGHLNPAVSFGAWLGRKMSAGAMLGYWVAQCLGAIAAAGLIQRVFAADVLGSVNLGTPLPGPGISNLQVIVVEIVLTFFLVFVVFGTAIDPRGPKCGGLFIGLAIAMGILVGGPISGAAMNPARFLGPALLSGNMGFCWIYWVAPLAGGGLAGLVYKQVIEK
jgi:aquaporin TIP